MRIISALLLWMWLLAVSTSSSTAQTQRCDSFWTGSWDTPYGQLRLIEDGDSVYGDYAGLGTIKANLDKVCGDWLRGTFERKDGRWGYVEFVETGDDGNRFSGRWMYSTQTGLPSWQDKRGTEWRGTRTDGFPPPILNFKPGETRDPTLKAPHYFHLWLNLSDRKHKNTEDQARREKEKVEREKRKAEAKQRVQYETAKNALRTKGWITSGLAAGRDFTTSKAVTAVTMQEHVQIVSTDGTATIEAQLKQAGYRLLGGGVITAAGIKGERLRSYVAKKENAVVVVFRGTGGDAGSGQTVPNIFITDARIKLIRPHYIDKSSALIGGEHGVYVHEGFHEAYNIVRPKILKVLAKEEKSNLFIFGHSLGGAMATLMAADMGLNQPHKFASITHIVSGSPRVGNNDFYHLFKRVVPDNLRIVVNEDPIPTIPKRARKAGSLSVEKYVHAGRLLTINEFGKPIDGDDIDMATELFKGFKKYHDNELYLKAVRKMRAKQPSSPVLGPIGNDWIYNTAWKERKRAAD